MIDRSVCSAEIGWHQVGVVEIGVALIARYSWRFSSNQSEHTPFSQHLLWNYEKRF